MISDQHKFIFVHTPKCAGSTMKALLETACRGTLRHDNWHFTIRELMHLVSGEAKDHARYFKFSLVRNPYGRLVSAFRYSANNISDPEDYHWDVYPDSYPVLEKYTASGDDPVVSFRRFVASRDFPMVLDDHFPVHFAPQHLFLAIDGTIAVDCLGHVETLEQSIRRIFQRLDLDVPAIPRINASSPMAYQDFFDEATRDRVYEIYRQDFELLGYDREIARPDRSPTMA